MKKQFFRVKQLADQAFLRADRSECLNNEELKQADCKVEFIQKTLSEIHKKLPTNTEALEKKKKKYNEHALGNSMIELSSEENEDFLHKLLKQCGDTELQLAEKLGDYETQLEQLVGTPITVILNKELPDIAKQKKNLNKYILDKDSATNRYSNAVKNGTQNNNLKDDMDEADIKVDQSRDALAIEMFGLLRQQNKISMSLIQLLKLQRSYHESALKQLESVIPEMEQMICDKEIKPVFQCELEDHLKHTRRKLAYPLELCVVALTELGMREEGLFRVAGGANRVKRLKLSIDSGCFALPLIQEYMDVHVLASTMKLYLRELPEPLLTYSLYNEWMTVVSKPEEQRVKAVQDILKKLPEQNRNNLAFLMHFLAKLSKHQENKMTSSNISIVIAPNLLWTHQTELNTNMKNCTTVNMIVELFIINVNQLFPDDMMSYITINREDIVPEEAKIIHQFRGHNSDSDSVSCDTASPKPSSRKKTKPAPAPPSATVDIGEMIMSSYPSGSTTLNRPHKTSLNKPKPLQSSTEELSKGSSDESTHNLVKPIDEFVKPVAAPRTSILPDSDKNINQNICVRRDSISKSMNSIDIDGEMVIVRRSSKEEYLERPGKPAIPVRPASLRATIIPKSEDSMQKTQCSIYSTPHKLQTSIVTIANKPVGHDNQIAEKEKFLGHQPQNKYSDINSNCHRKPDLPTKPNHMKSNEKLNVIDEKISNGNARVTSHIRTRSDGNIVDIHGDGVPNLMHTPPSPRSLNKPSQPPPPPPNKTKSEPETTTF